MLPLFKPAFRLFHQLGNGVVHLFGQQAGDLAGRCSEISGWLEGFTKHDGDRRRGG